MKVTIPIRKNVQAAAWLVFCLFLALIVTKSFHRHQSWVDATAFICGAQAVREHQSPYLVEPLHSCEIERFAAIGHPEWSAVVTPSPLPYYAFLPFIPISYLGQKAALAVWYALLVGAIAISCVMLARLTRFHLPLVFLALFMPCVYLSFALGQIVPFILCATVAAVWFHKLERPVPAALCAVFTMIEPHLGLPLCIALFIIERRARLPLFAGAIVLGAASLALGSLDDNIRYFREVLPIHAATEVRDDEQLSLTHAAWLFGASEKLALSLGSLSSLISMIAGCVVAVLLSRTQRLRDCALLAAPSFGLIGGAYSHVPQFSIFLAFTLVLASRIDIDVPKLGGLHPQFAALLATALFDLPLIVSNLRIDVYMYMGLTMLLAHFLLRLKPIATILATAAVGIATFSISQFRRAHDLTPDYALAFQQHIAEVTTRAHFADDVWLVNMHDLAYQIFGKLALLIDLPIYLAIALAVYAVYAAYRAEQSRGAITKA